MNGLFRPGNIVATPGAFQMAESGVNLIGFLTRHLRGDWSEMCEEDQRENEFAL